MVGSLLIIGFVAFGLLALEAWTKSNVTRELYAQYYNLSSHKQSEIGEFIGLLSRYHRSSVRNLLWSWVAILFMLVIAIAFRASFWPTGIWICLSVLDYIFVYSLLDFFRYCPRRIKLESEMDQWLDQHQESSDIISRLNREVRISDYLPKLRLT